MNVLVTGGAGFIGSHVVDLLIELGHRVIIADDLSHGRKENINPKALFFKMDIVCANLEGVFREQQIEAVIHLAAQVNARMSLKEPIHDANVNIMGSLQVLEMCRTFGIKKIVYASSVAVYGNPRYLPCDEGHALEPISNYGISKRCTEEYLHLYQKMHGIDYMALRFSNVYGPRQDPNGEAGVVSIFIDKLLNGQVPFIFGDGKQTREFIFVEDVAQATVLALTKNTEQKIINISSDSRISVNELLMMLKKITNSNSEHVHEKEIKGEIRHMSLDITMAKKELGWYPRTNLEEGLRKTVGFFRLNEKTISA